MGGKSTSNRTPRDTLSPYPTVGAIRNYTQFKPLASRRDWRQQRRNGMTINALIIALILAVLLYAVVALGPRPQRVRVRIDQARDNRYRRRME